MTKLSRRGFLGAMAAGGAAAALPVTMATGASAAPGRFPARFADPAREFQAKFRWWWPHGLVDPVEIAREIDQIADAGFGGVEIADVHHSVDEPMDPAGHGWGTPAWVEALEAALTRANERGVIVDMTVGPAWPAALPTITPDDAAAMQELAHGVALVEDGVFRGAVPEPAVSPAEGVTARKLFTVQVARLVDGEPAQAPYPLEADSVQDVTESVEDGRLEFSAPDDGRWLVISTWLRGCGQRPERGPHTKPVSYVVDHFSRTGTQAVIDFWEERILTPRIRDLLRSTGGAMFEDSIEMETEATLWTPDLPEQFRQRKGYDLLPYLPIVLEEDEDEVFAFGGDIDRRVRDDLNDVRSELYIEEHIEVLQDWLHGLGLQLRIQPYGLETDAVTKAAVVDIAEGESLGFNNLDDFRSLAGGRDLGGRTILSSEAAAVYGGSYSTTWDHVVRTVSREYTAGVNQAVLHGFSYADAPGAQWPGFAAFTPYGGGVGYSESWGPRHPIWDHAPDVAGFLARSQLVLQTGRARVDVAFLRQKGYAGTGFGAAWFSSEGVRHGWTHQFVSPRLLEVTDARVARGRLAPDGPGYRLLVFEGDAFNGRVETMPLATARRLLEFARGGLPMIIVGSWAAPQVPGIAAPGENDELASVFAELLAQPSVHRVDTRDDIPAAVAATGLEPQMRHAEASPMLHAHRRSSDAEYYYLVNSSDDEAVDHDVTFTTGIRPAVPYWLDPWTGEVSRVVVHESGAGWVRLRVRLAPGAVTAVALARPSWRGNGVAVGRSVVDTEADEIVEVDGRVMVRAHAAGTYVSTLANGRTVSTVVDAVPDEITLSRWELTVDDWQPGDSATETVVTTHDVTLDSPTAWTEVSGLEDVSGVGRYSTVVDLPESWTGWPGGPGAYLHLGEVSDTFRVAVNGTSLAPADQASAVVDVGAYLQPGPNTIVVEVASTLINRMRVTRPEVYGDVARARYGLSGPVRLVPYGQARLM